MKVVKEPEYKKRIGYQASLLGGFSTIATILLVMGNISTKEDIILRQQEDLQQSLAQVIPAEIYDNNLLENTLLLKKTDGKEVVVYRAMKQQQLTALAWEISGIGYAGEMRFIFSVDKNGEILGVRVLSHTETPGLGDKIEVEKDDWMLGFNGLSLENTSLANWKVKKDGGQFDAFSGATITPRGTVLAIVEGLKFFQQQKQQLLDVTALTTEAATVNVESTSLESSTNKVKIKSENSDALSNKTATTGEVTDGN